ncbi:anaerobic magnesium-protoporphyrin IX monomethyl ester cyclase [Novosphingobium sp. CF614]|uniref:magnesium-protoporphyrin IX monomethyl ester anaerobic oxidative cyclase n=1 Tax=Novosphingobium sp. CF614 TaxID=1884364 RepID=UPI0008DFB661|nr:magnesium-protoporphyrin IX monomethyl ester anaerobic oxidative cyclase [Novosphingobium sp. CF614]SFF78799.1 anaerobic magnesium-protoporphyrin IX monomethyl ester cyclase [Novosphingobium sp. CF614]
MRILLVNVPHPAIGSRIPKEQLPPLGLLSIGGPLIDDGHEVRLIDGEFGPMPLETLVAQAVEYRPDAVLFGHSGSSSGHPVIARYAAMMRRSLPGSKIVYGGVHPTYFWREILAAEPWLDAIVRGEGEETVRRLIQAFEENAPLDAIEGLAFHRDGVPFATAAAPVIRNLDDYRIGWELIDHARYSYWGGKRAVVVQFSRGCPHLCTYCGQRGFWTRWRHRDPVLFAREIAWLHREHGVQVFNFADENPSAGRKPWKAFLEALIAENIDVTLVGSTRADDIVRDAEFLHLYKQAGFERFLMGMENTDEDTLRLIRKGAKTSTDREAIRLLRRHNILSMATWVAGFSEQTDRDLFRGLKQLISYDPDQIQALYVTPHRWTPYFREAEGREVVQVDQTKWDYKHQVLAMQCMPPWRLFLWVKFIEAACQLRPRALLRWLWHPEPKIQHAIRWYYRMGRRVWFHEIFSFLFRDHAHRRQFTLAEFVGQAQDAEEEAMTIGKRPATIARLAEQVG